MRAGETCGACVHYHKHKRLKDIGRCDQMNPRRVGDRDIPMLVHATQKCYFAVSRFVAREVPK